MFAGLYAAQLRNWLAVFDPKQFIVVPMDCYTEKGPSAVLKAVGDAAGLAVGKSIADLDRRFKPENEKRLRQIAKEGSDTAAQANRHGEQPIPAAAAKQLKYFFKREGDSMQALLKEYPDIRVIECGLTHFFRRCNETYCRPSFEAELATIDQALLRDEAYRKATADSGGAWRRSSAVQHSGTDATAAKVVPAMEDDDDPEAILGADGLLDWGSYNDTDEGASRR